MSIDTERTVARLLDRQLALAERFRATPGWRVMRRRRLRAASRRVYADIRALPLRDGPVAERVRAMERGTATAEHRLTDTIGR